MMVPNHIAALTCQILNLSVKSNVCPQTWSEAKVIPLPKNAQTAFTGFNRFVPYSKNCIQPHEHTMLVLC